MTTSGIIRGPALVHGKALIEGRAIFEGAALLQGAVHTRLSFSGSLTVEKGSAGPHFTLVILNNPGTNPYDGFAEVTDADNVSTIANTDEVTISGALGAHVVSYKATSSGGRPDISLLLTVTLVDTTAPVLTLPTDTKTGQTTATLTVTTDTGEGTLYTVVTTSSTPPSAAQVIAGQDHSGVAAAFANSVAVASTGLKTVSATGLTAATAYTTFFVQKDASNNVSLVSAADGFTTDGSEQAETTAWVNAVVGDGGTVSSGRRTLVDNLIVALKAANAWTVLDRLPIFAAENTQSALRELKSAALMTVNGTMTFTVDRGYTGNGSTGYIDPNFNPVTAAGQYSLNSAHISVWSRTNQLSQFIMGSRVDSGTQVTDIAPGVSGGNNTCVYAVNQNSQKNFTNAASNATHMLVERTASNAISFWNNGVVSDTDSSAAASAMYNEKILIGCLNQAGSAVAFVTNQIAMASIGSGLGGVELGFYNALQTYMTAVGA